MPVYGMLNAAFIVALSSSPSCRVSSFLGTSAYLRSAAARNSRRATSTTSAVSTAATRATTIMPSSPTFIDIGANLLDDVFQGRYHGGSQKHEPDLDAVLERAEAAGVEKVRDMACRWDRLYPASSQGIAPSPLVCVYGTDESFESRPIG